MSSAIGFKQQCPSCGGLVNIKNPDLVGKKVDCPKCKYRFIVESPEGEGSDGTNGAPAPKAKKKERSSEGPVKRINKERRRPREDDDDGGKKKGSNKMLYVLAGVGVVLLVVVGVLIFVFGGGDGNKDDVASAPPPRKPEKRQEENLDQKFEDLWAKAKADPKDPKVREELLALLTGDSAEAMQAKLAEKLAEAKNQGEVDEAITQLGEGLDQEKVRKLKGDMVARLADKFGPTDLADEPTNMIPNDTQVLLHIVANKFINSTFGNTVFGRGTFKTSDLDAKLGLRVESLEKMIIASNRDNNTVMVVLRTSDAYNWDEVKKALQVEPESKKTMKGKEYWLGKVDFLAEFMDKRFPLAALKRQAAILPKAPRTLIYGDETTIKKFLEEPPELRYTTPPPAAGGGGGFPGAPGAGFPGRPSSGGGAGSGAVGIGDGPPAGAGGYPGAPAGVGPGAGGGPPAGAGAGGSGQAQLPGGPPAARGGGGAGSGAVGIGDAPPPGAGGGYPGAPPGMGPGAPGAGGAPPAGPRPEDKFYLTIDKNFRRVIEMSVDKKQPILVYADASKKPAASSQFYYFEKLAAAQQRLVEAISMAVHQEDHVTLRLVALCKEKKDSEPVKKELVRLFQDAAKNELKDALGFEFDIVDLQATGGTGFGFGPGRGGPGFPGGPGGVGGPGAGYPGAPPGAGGGPGFAGPGGGPGFAGGGGGNVGLPGAPPGAEGGRGGGGNVGLPGAPPGFGGPEGSGAPAEERVEKPRIEIGKFEEFVTIVITVLDKAEGIADEHLGPRVADYRAKADLGSNRLRMSELANGLTLMRTTKQDTFPMGALPRRPDPSRGLRPWPANERVSWMRELLPYLGDNSYNVLYGDINPDQSWKHPDNLKAGRHLVAQFVHPGSGQYYTKVRGSSQQLAVTHFVGMAGIGPDAPYYAASDPRAGIFGYDRETKLAEITDGISNTIYMIQTDSSIAGPWIAGGGATLRGTSERGDDVGKRGGFVAPNYAGKQGTWIIMADGSVRFLTKDVAPEVFKAMCTKAGNDQVSGLDSVAPKASFGTGGAKPGTPPPPAPSPPKAEEKKPTASPPAKKPTKEEEEEKPPAKKDG
jgi:hypothetical protein